MNRIELVAQNSTVKPLEMAQPNAPIATVALVAVGLGAAALGYQVGYHLGGTLEDHESQIAAELAGQPSSSTLLDARRTAIAL